MQPTVIPRTQRATLFASLGLAPPRSSSPCDSSIDNDPFIIQATGPNTTECHLYFQTSKPHHSPSPPIDKEDVPDTFSELESLHETDLESSFEDSGYEIPPTPTRTYSFEEEKQWEEIKQYMKQVENRQTQTLQLRQRRHEHRSHFQFDKTRKIGKHKKGGIVIPRKPGIVHAPLPCLDWVRENTNIVNSRHLHPTRQSV